MATPSSISLLSGGEKGHSRKKIVGTSATINTSVSQRVQPGTNRPFGKREQESTIAVKANRSTKLAGYRHAEKLHLIGSVRVLVPAMHSVTSNMATSSAIQSSDLYRTMI